MTRPNSRSIARKALTLGVVPAVCTLLIVSAAFFIAALVLGQRSAGRDMDALAAVVRDNVSASLGFNDRDTATDVLTALRAKQNIDGVCVFDKNGDLFASFTAGTFRCAPSMLQTKSHSGRLVRIEPVTIGNKPVGVVQLIGNDRDLYEVVIFQGLVTAAALVFGAVVALVLANRMQRAISQPVLDLATAARQVTVTGDYTIRARKTSGDEVGALADAFNTMLQQIQHHSRAKDEFLAALSHELRTPLNAILGWLHIIKSTAPEGERLARALSALDRNARAQTRLVEDLLEVSRIVTGKLQLTLSPVDLRDVIAAAIESVGPLASNASVHVTTQVPDTPCLVSGDTDRLRQVVANLLSNGLKFTPAGGTVSVDLAEEDGSFVLTVTDTGIGISADFLPHVFDRFRQSDGSTTREHGGLGLGLAIVKEITEVHGGYVIARSKGKHQGATFIIRLPQLVNTRTLAAEATRPPIPSGTRDGALAGIRALVVDDNEDSLEISAASLRAAGASVDVASSGEQALRMWTPATYRLLVCDLAMPHIDGFEVLKRVREIDASARTDLAAVALTAHADEEMRQRTKCAGFDAHLTKPLDGDVFVALVRKLVAAKEAPGGERVG